MPEITVPVQTVPNPFFENTLSIGKKKNPLSIFFSLTNDSKIIVFKFFYARRSLIDVLMIENFSKLYSSNIFFIFI